MDISIGDIIKPNYSDNEYFIVTALHGEEGGIYGKDISGHDTDELYLSYSDIESVFKKQ